MIRTVRAKGGRGRPQRGKHAAGSLAGIRLFKIWRGQIANDTTRTFRSGLQMFKVKAFGFVKSGGVSRLGGCAIDLCPVCFEVKRNLRSKHAYQDAVFKPQHMTEQPRRMVDAIERLAAHALLRNVYRLHGQLIPHSFHRVQQIFVSHAAPCYPRMAAGTSAPAVGGTIPPVAGGRGPPPCAASFPGRRGHGPAVGGHDTRGFIPRRGGCRYTRWLRWRWCAWPKVKRARDWEIVPMPKILLAVSEHWICDRRIDALASWTARLQAGVLVVHIVAGALQEGRTETPGERILREVTARMLNANPNTESLLLFANDIVEAINKTILSHNVSMLAIGLSRPGLLERLIEGNVQRSLLAACRIPILALPADWDGVL